MALSNYTDLKTAVASWMKRSDVTAKVPDYITLAEKKIVKLATTPGYDTKELDMAAIAKRALGEA